jgi:hypothetical protein
MRKNLLLFLLFISSCMSAKFIKISKIINNEYNQDANQKGVTFNDVRIRLYNLNKLKFLNLNTDTFYILETQDLQNGIVDGRIWNRSNVINYSFYKNKFNFSDSSFMFDTKINELIQNWNTSAIRNNEFKQRLIDGSYIYGTRVELNNGNFKIDTISFWDFNPFHQIN